MNKLRNKIRRYFLWIFLVPVLASAAETSQLTAIRFSTANNTARIVLSLSQPTNSEVFTLSNPERLVIDLRHTRLNTSIKNLSFPVGGIQSVRSGKPNSSTLRLVLDTVAPIYFKVLSQPRDAVVIIDIQSPAVKKTIAKKQSVAPSLPTWIKPTAIVKPKARPIVIVIDAGHGGKDSGAIGPLGTKEKDITLAVAMRLAQMINQDSMMRAVLTRDGDYFVPLRGRLKLARKGNADLFIALHADSFFNDHALGASVYTLSQHGASSEAARWLAQRDNYSELGGVDLSELGDKSYLLRSVLIDLAQTATTTDSLHLGSVMLSSLSNITQLHYRRVEQAPFMVLKSPDIPSILIEMGFISNEREEIHLRDRRYQSRIAQALFEGIRYYLKKYPITGV